MRNAVVVSFYFAVDRSATSAPKFDELFVVEPDGTKTEFGGKDAPSPAWSYSLDDSTPEL